MPAREVPILRPVARGLWRALAAHLLALVGAVVAVRVSVADEARVDAAVARRAAVEERAVGSLVAAVVAVGPVGALHVVLVRLACIDKVITSFNNKRKWLYGTVSKAIVLCIMEVAPMGVGSSMGMGSTMGAGSTMGMGSTMGVGSIMG